MIILEEIKKAVAKNLTELRKSRGMTQFELANSLNYSDKAISKWERGESLPDVCTLKTLAQMFGVTVDYLIESDHPAPPLAEDNVFTNRKVKNYGFITAISIIGVWFLATLFYVAVSLVTDGAKLLWLCFVYAMPVTFIVWLVLNSIWFNKRRNFVIISLLVWTALAAIFLTLLPVTIKMWRIFLLGIPAQIIILFSAGIKPYGKK